MLRQWFLLIVAAACCGTTLRADESLSAPTTLSDPSESQPLAVGCANGHCRKSCWRKLKDWVCYHPCEKTSCGDCHRMNSPRPPLYTYFQSPPCLEGTGTPCCKKCANGFGQRNGLDVSGHRMLDVPTGQGTGLLSSAGQLK